MSCPSRPEKVVERPEEGVEEEMTGT